METKIAEFVRCCEYCQRFKTVHRQYGELPPKDIQNKEPWEEVDCDTIGPWIAKINNFEYKENKVINLAIKS